MPKYGVFSTLIVPAGLMPRPVLSRLRYVSVSGDAVSVSCAKIGVPFGSSPISTIRGIVRCTSWPGSSAAPLSFS